MLNLDMKLLSFEIDELTHEELATRAIRSGDDELAGLGHDLQQAVDDERDSSAAAEAIRAYVEAEHTV